MELLHDTLNRRFREPKLGPMRAPVSCLIFHLLCQAAGFPLFMRKGQPENRGILFIRKAIRILLQYGFFRNVRFAVT